MGLTLSVHGPSMMPRPAPIDRAVNMPPTPRPSRRLARDPATTNLLAWQELQRQLEELHARLLYAKLMIKLGVRAP